MSFEEPEKLAGSLSSCAIYVQSALLQLHSLVAGKLFLNGCLAGIPRSEFRELHFGYTPVPEVYVLRDVFDSFCPPRRYLHQLHDELRDDVNLDLFLEALGCYFEPAEAQRGTLNKLLAKPMPRAADGHRTGLVLMCWDRMRDAARVLGEEGEHYLIYVVAFHEHSHAARASRVLKTGSEDVLRAEETVSQYEAYMFLRSRREQWAIEVMRKLMEKQPLCYQIRIPP